MELDATSINLCRSGRLIMHVNKVHHHKDDPTLLKRSDGDK